MSYIIRFFHGRSALQRPVLRHLATSNYTIKSSRFPRLYLHRLHSSIPLELEAKIENLVGPRTKTNHASLPQELNTHFSESLPHTKDFIELTTGSHIVEQLISEKKNTEAALFIVSLLKNQNVGARILLDTCARLLSKSSVIPVTQILQFWHDKFDLAVKPGTDVHELAALLVSTACNKGDPLAAASLCLILDNAKILSQWCVDQTVSSLLLHNGDRTQYNIKAILELNKRLQNTSVVLSSHQKGQLVRLGTELSSEKFPSMLNDTFNLAIHTAGGEIPYREMFNMIRSNLLYNNTSRAALIATALYNRGTSIENYDIHVLGLMIKKFSKTRKYLRIARHLVSLVTEEYYNVEGLTEILLSYCARTKDQDLAVKVYAQLNAPIPRTVLTSLLHLHISLGDNEGAEKILKEISRRNDALLPVEFSMIVEVALQQSLDKAVELVRKNTPSFAKFAYGPVINKAIELGEVEIADEFINLVYNNFHHNDIVFDGIATLIIKRILKTQTSRDARLQWLQWKSGNHPRPKIKLPSESTQIISLRAIADRAMVEGDSSVVHWVVQELRHLGMHMSDIRKELLKRKNAHNISSHFFHNEPNFS